MPWLLTLYTEWKSNLPNLVTKHFPGATLQKGIGIWRGGKENSAAIEVISEKPILDSFKALAKEIKQVNHQSAVIVKKLWAESPDNPLRIRILTLTGEREKEKWEG